MPAKRVSKRPAELEEPEPMSDPDDEIPPFRTASSSTDPPPTGHATRGPNMEKAVADADEAAQWLEAMRGIFKKEDSKLLVAKRLFKAKMARFNRAADDVNTSAVQELEKYYKAKLELAEATLRHGTVELMVAQAETSAEKVLGAVKDAKIARLRLNAS